MNESLHASNHVNMEFYIQQKIRNAKKNKKPVLHEGQKFLLCKTLKFAVNYSDKTVHKIFYHFAFLK